MTTSIEEIIARGSVSERLAEAGEWFNDHGEMGSFKGYGDLDIAYVKLLQSDPKAPVLVLFTGWSETLVKYPELMFDLFHASGVSIYAMDHRDQGLSGRERDDVNMMTHIDSFEHHLDDAKMFIHQVVRPQINKAAQDAFQAQHTDNNNINNTGTQSPSSATIPRMYTYGFSLGGLVAARVAVDEPDLFDAVVLVAPALVVNTKFLPSLAAELVTDFMCLIGSCESFVVSTGTTGSHELPYPPKSLVSRSVERISFWENIRRDVPSTNINGLSYSHLREMLRYRLDREEQFARLHMPVLVVTADNDTHVDNSAHITLNNAAPRSIQLLIKDALHEACSEHDLVRDQAVGAIATFLANPDAAVPVAQYGPHQIASNWAMNSATLRETKMMPSFQTREEVTSKIVMVAFVFLMHFVLKRIFGRFNKLSSVVQPTKRSGKSSASL